MGWILKETATYQYQTAITRVYFTIASILAIAELLEAKSVIYILKPTLIPALIFLYLYTSKLRNPIYVLSLLFGLVSNISFLFTSESMVIYGFVSFMIYRMICIYLVVRLIKKFFLLPFIVATLPFLFIFSCLLNLTLSSDVAEFYPAAINAVLISALSGLALSNYVMEDSKTNSWLAISTLLFIVLIFLFMFQKYYITNIVFQPISALIFAFGHYAFYKFVIESEKPAEKEIRLL